jgi:hypothetical protein
MTISRGEAVKLRVGTGAISAEEGEHREKKRERREEGGKVRGKISSFRRDTEILRTNVFQKAGWRTGNLFADVLHDDVDVVLELSGDGDDRRALRYSALDELLYLLVLLRRLRFLHLHDTVSGRYSKEKGRET